MVMKRNKVIISFKARDSLKSHIEYLKKEVSEETALHVRKGILNKCAQLKDFSGYSRERYLEDEPGEYRSVTIWGYNIIYTRTDSEIRILNIIHTSQHPLKRKNI
jgi:plasmid stabilization system protein ParE